MQLHKLALIGILSLVLGSFLVPLYHPFFSLEEFRLTPIQFVEKSELDDILKSYSKQNIFQIMYFTDLEDTILESFPMIDSVKLKLKPPHRIVINIKEKKPWLTLVDKGRSRVISQDGTILNQHSDYQVDSITNLLIVKSYGSQLFQDEKVHQPSLNKLQTMMKYLTNYFLELDLQIEFKGEQDWVLLKEDTLPMSLGTLDDLEQKLIKLKQFLTYYEAQPNKKGIRTIDLRVPKKVLVDYE